MCNNVRDAKDWYDFPTTRGFRTALSGDILIQVVDHIKVYGNGNIKVRFKIADELRRIVEYIRLTPISPDKRRVNPLEYLSGSSFPNKTHSYSFSR